MFTDAHVEERIQNDYNVTYFLLLWRVKQKLALLTNYFCDLDFTIYFLRNISL